MADKKIIGKLENIITFSVNKASLNQALASIKKIKEAMNGISKPIQAAQKPMQAMKKMKSDYLIVQKQLDKTEKSQLKTAESLYRARDKQALAEQKIANQRRAQAVRGLTAKSGAGKASQTAFADMLRGEGRQSASELKRQRELNRAHTQAIIEDRKRAADAIAKIQTSETKALKKAANEQNALNNRNKNRDEKAQATNYGFRQLFGREAERKASDLYNQMREGKITYSMYNKEISLLRNNLFKAQRAQRGFNQSIHDMRGAFIQATASYTAFAGVMGIASTGKAFQGYQSSMEMAFGGEKGAAPFIEYLRSEIRRLGLDVQQTTDDFSKFAIAAKGKVSDSDLKNIFTGYQQYATAAGTSKERTSLGMNAIKQMFDKDFVYSEEFNV